MPIRFLPVDPVFVASVRVGGLDAYGLPPECAVSDGADVPCRSCLRDTPRGDPYLILAARPFDLLGPYAETGPIFLCAKACAPWRGAGVPSILRTSPDYVLRGYCRNQRIVPGTGRVVRAADLYVYAEKLLARDEIAHVDVRSARNGCFQTRAVRA